MTRPLNGHARSYAAVSFFSTNLPKLRHILRIRSGHAVSTEILIHAVKIILRTAAPAGAGNAGGLLDLMVTAWLRHLVASRPPLIAIHGIAALALPGASSPAPATPGTSVFLVTDKCLYYTGFELPIKKNVCVIKHENPKR